MGLQESQTGLGRSDIDSLRKLLATAGFPLSGFFVPLALALAAALFEAVGVVLLIPTIRASLRLDFESLARDRIAAFCVWLWPRLSRSSGKELYLWLLALVLASNALRIALAYASSKSCAVLARRMSAVLRQAVFDRCLGFGKLFFDVANAGHLQNCLIDSTGLIAGRVIVIEDILVWAAMLAAYVPIMFWITWKVTCLVIGFLPVMIYAEKRLRTRLRRNSKAAAEKRRSLGGRVANTLSCIALIQASSSQNAESARFRSLNAEVAAAESAVDVWESLVRGAQEAIALAAFVVALYALACWGARESSGVAPALLVYVYLLRRSSTAMSFLGRFHGTAAALRGPVNELLEFMEDTGKFQVIGGAKRFSSLSEGLECRGLRFAFPDGTEVLKGFTASFRKAAVTAVVGQSGVGKTTLVNLLMRFYDCSPGTILADGVDIRDYSLQSLRRKFALISQTPTLLHDTVRVNATYPLGGRVPENQLNAALERAGLLDFVERLPQGLDTMIGDRGAKMSGGERQRLAIARAILSDAEVLILDEATSSLDPATERHVQDSLSELWKDKTVIIVAHKLSSVRSADQFVVIDDGRAVESGSWDDLMRRDGALRGFWRLQESSEQA